MSHTSYHSLNQSSTYESNHHTVSVVAQNFWTKRPQKTKLYTCLEASPLQNKAHPRDVTFELYRKLSELTMALSYKVITTI